MGRLNAAVLATLLLGTFAAEASAAAPRVTIRRDAQGTPTIVAKDFRSLGYGFARAHVQDNLCVLADVYMTVDGDRSRFLGPDATYPIRNTGTTPNNLNSDFFWKGVIADRRVEELVAEPPPNGPRREVKDTVTGYVEGFNDELAALGGADGVEDPACKGKPWVRPIDEGDVYRRFFQLGELASAMAALDGIGSAQPPTPALPLSAPSAEAAVRGLAPGEVDRHLVDKGVGSNAIALGGAATENGKGLLLGNPHQPWLGAERFFQSHLVIPGKLDVSGGSLYGAPVVNIGFNRNLAWSHTVSTARRFAIYEETLVPGSPTTYLVDGKPREMSRTTVTVAALVGGKLENRTRTLYETVHGQLTVSLTGLPIFPWTPAKAFVLNDANRENFGRLFNHFLEADMAGSVAELDGILEKYQGIPWVTTIAADRAGKAMFSDVSSVPGVTNELRTRCQTALGLALDTAQRVAVLDGAQSSCDPQTGPGARGRGLLGPAQQPQLIRDDYATNSNDSYWLSNPRQPLEGFPRIHGDERTVRSVRTRLGVKMVEEGIAGGSRFNTQELRELMLNNRQHVFELWKGQLPGLCAATQPADVCAALALYRGRDDRDARGALLFRRFVARAITATPSPYAVAFDPADPVGTPRGLATENPQVRLALGDAVADLRGAGIPLDAPLGDFQGDNFHGERIPIGGGPQNLGLFNHLGVQWDPKSGYANVSEGATYVQTVGFDDTACGVQAQTLIGHSQSTDSTSPWFRNGTERLAAKTWTPQPFCAADILGRTRPTARFGGGGERTFARGLTARRRGGTLRVGVLLREPARLTVRVERGGRLVRRVVRRAKPGRASIVLRGVPRGRAVVRVRAQADGRARTLVKRVR